MKNVVDVIVPLGRVPPGIAVDVAAQKSRSVIVILKNQMDLAAINEFIMNCFR